MYFISAADILLVQVSLPYNIMVGICFQLCACIFISIEESFNYNYSTISTATEQDKTQITHNRRL
jgi:YbbR domain-containing protein